MIAANGVCGKCGAKISGDATREVCPACLLQAGKMHTAREIQVSGKMSPMDSVRKVFLSHSGLDHKLANELARRIEREIDVRVFDTSEPEYRFKELKEFIQAGTMWSVESERYDTELKDYLKKNLLSSEVYILLATKRSLEANSSWIEFEMKLAHAEAQKRGLFFFPCVAEGSSLSSLPEIAIEFQGIELDAEDGFKNLLDCVSRTLSKPHQRRSWWRFWR